LFSLGPEEGKPRAVTPAGIRPWFLAGPGGKSAAIVDVKGQIFLQPLAGGAPTQCRGSEPGELPQAWGADESTLYVKSFSGVPAKVYLVDCQTGRRTLWKEIMPQDRAGVDTINHVRITPDGRSYAYSYTQQLSELFLVDGLK
jgi:hypothetical protein